MPDQFLREIHKMYVEKYGHGVRNLGEFKVTIAAHELFAQRIPNLFEQSGRVIKPLIKENFQELEARGFLRKGEPLWYHLTAEGYYHSERTSWQRFVGYWNSNPGLNTLVTIASAIIAVFSLGVAIQALSNSTAQTPPPALPYKVAAK
ncbi:hypothetical protein EC849_102201 [Pseudomonas putida]|uniref:hypothetical protein n=1 Tax=Pseudomonas putida TaxID=303 RepID=UPI00104E4C91|nr:hypothetical protein [Pseudomonas putida]TCP78366.1 hypothetical protein EC849_102201 [Pseudomonas putida]